ncbi:sugar transferase [Thioalkalivibrio sp.]|uniref:sugar transferase n=1 Tax=Thioalkalivibrio sp. TaxID=2093813 RepID=UPI003976F041
MDWYIKRSIDLLLAVVGLVLAAPLMGLIAIAVRLDSPGRVIFSQERLGQHGRVFRMHKFRKFPDTWGDRGAGVTVSGDARMTRLGHFLERSKFDELPQLWNILKGEMSFVGPRPETLRFRDLFQGEFRRVHDFLPGIFGPNQVAFRNEALMYPPDRDPETFYREALFPQKARQDIAYFSRSTAFSDLLWIVRGTWHSVVGAVDWRRQARLRGPIFLVDLLAVQLAWIAANVMRFDGLPSGIHWEVWLTGLWLMPLVILPVIAIGGSYQGAVRHYAVGDLLRLVRSSIAGWTLAFLVLLAFFERNAALGLLPAGLLLAVAMSAGVRVLQRERVRSAQRRSRRGGRARLAIYGAGHRGAALAALLEHGFPRAQVVGFLDDHVSAQRVSGHRVLGAERDLDTVQAVHEISEIWMTFDPDKRKNERLRNWAVKHGVKIVVLPVLEPFFSLTERRRVAPAPGFQLKPAPSSGRLETGAG